MIIISVITFIPSHLKYIYNNSIATNINVYFFSIYVYAHK